MQPDNVELLSPVSLEEGHLSESDLQVLIFGSTVAIKLTAFIRRKKLQMQPDNVELLSPVSLEEGHLSESDLQVIF